MKRRVVTTYKLLAVALAGTAGCARSLPAVDASASVGESPRAQAAIAAAPSTSQVVEEAASAADSAPPAADAPAATAPVDAAATAPLDAAIAAAAPDRTPLCERSGEAAPKARCTQAYNLRDSLPASKGPLAIPAMQRFRPLCDEDGYPIVGNLMTKNAGGQTTPSQVCEALRTSSGGRS